MKITRMWRCSLWRKLSRRTLLIMRFSVVLLFGIFIQVSANSLAQKVVLQKNQMTYKEVFKEIENQTGLITIYSANQVNKSEKVNISAEEAELSELYESLLQDKGLTFEFVDDYIVIRPFNQTEKAAINKRAQQPEEKKLIISGSIKDEKGEPLPFAAIRIKGTTIGTVSDADGNYNLQFDEQESVVFEISSLGFETAEVIYDGQSTINITLIESIAGLDEVVVTGYQTISRERATGSFSMLNSDNVANSPNETIGGNLESLVAGVQSTVDANGDVQFTIRGVSSLNGNTQPLIVVDGFAIDGGFESVNRNDVAKITVLKDAAASSIWGARAANGVIVITTKQGQAKKGIQVEVEAFTKFSDAVDLDYANPIASSQSQLEYEMFLWQNGYVNPSLGITNINQTKTYGHEQFEAQQMDHLNSGGTGLANFTLDTPVLQDLLSSSYKDQVKDEMLRKATSQNYTVSLRGQGEKNSYSLSVMYNKNNDVMVEDNDDNILINFRNNMKVSKWLDFDVGIMSQMQNRNSRGVGLTDIKQMSAYETLLDENGNYKHINSGPLTLTQPGTYNMPVLNEILDRGDGWTYDNFNNNPLQNMRSQDFNTKTFSTRINGGLKFKIADGISFDSKFQHERSTIKTRNVFGEESYYTRKTVNSFAVTDYNAIATPGAPYTITDQQVPAGEMVYVNNGQRESTLFRNQLSFNKTYGDHSINFIGGTELIWNEYETQDDWLYGFNDRNYQNIVPDAYNGLTQVFSPPYVTTSLPRGGETRMLTNRFFSLYSNLAYTYKDKYTFSGSVRTDASNSIVDDNSKRYSPFWSVGGSWQLSKEEFIKDITWLNRLSLRTTYGVNGNAPSTSASVPVLQFVPGSQPWSGAGVDNAYLVELGNPTLGWEKVKQFNVAVDFAVLKNKLYGSLEYYNKNSEDQLALISLPSTDGTTSQYFNAAAMKNTGFEMSLNGNINLGPVKWHPILNFAYNDNLVTDVKEVEILLGAIGGKRFVEDYPYLPAWHYKYNGLNADGIPTVLGKNGEVYDANMSIEGTGVAATDLLWNTGSYIAPVVSSFTNEFSYKNFSLLATITGKFGHYMPVSGFGYGVSTFTQNYHENLDEMISGNHEAVGEFPLPDGFIPGYNNYNPNARYLESRVEDASFIKLKDIMLSYQLPQSIISKIGCSGVRLYAQMSNVGLLWTANDLGIDPEYPQGGSFFRPERTYTLGLNLKF
ncbi:SusC/RagA family TonB-linked outer membrane protein [Carboxylicivirga sp. M1479]|uniref:SusC/RagA family TonB-linked outer membrane protein n=1 Tax=Carboxylicivirga sp. M1479 TaxID=2594476 RepID=UPI001178BEC0|nr:SusC/RagA family TonB-linked outer membrane protein [Carboxylicivirga sp. M1479]TRX71438.1 SusC/RagA family TonB-linked outer membrane protein [Carboxylicivirga sp. M1479]